MSSLVRWGPFRKLVSLREAIDRYFEESFVRSGAGRLLPAGVESLVVDMYATDDVIVVKAPIPGIEAEDLDISVRGDTLTIRGETRAEEEVKEENYIRRERRYGSFYRSLAILKSIVADGAKAELRNGVLALTLLKAEEVKPKVIEVNPG